MSDRKTMFDLKQKAKWSSDSEERKTAIKELSAHGENAILELQEIMNITAYEDIKSACAEAIKSIRGGRKIVEVNENSTNYAPSAENTSTTTTKDQKKEEEFKKEVESS